MPSFGPDTEEQVRFRLNPRAMFSVVDGEAVILELDRGEYFGLNRVGTRVWQLLEQGAGLNAVFDSLLEEFEVDRATLEPDIQDLLRDLEGHQLLQRAADGEDSDASKG